MPTIAPLASTTTIRFAILGLSEPERAQLEDCAIKLNQTTLKIEAAYSLVDADVVIVDQREAQSSAPELPHACCIAVVHDRPNAARKSFARGYAEVITWPPNSTELASRLAGQFALITKVKLQGPKWSTDPLVEQVCHILMADLAHPFSVDELSSKVGVGRNTINQRFKAAFEQTPMRWLRDQRLTAAALRLRLSEEPLSSIAASVGYEDAANFATAFKRAFRHSPSTYRKLSALIKRNTTLRKGNRKSDDANLFSQAQRLVIRNRAMRT